MRSISKLTRIACLVLAATVSIGCATEEPVPAPESLPEGESVRVTIDRVVIDGRKVLVASDAAGEVLSTMHISEVEGRITQRATLGAFGSESVIETTTDVQRDLYQVRIAGPAGAGAWETSIEAPVDPPAAYLEAVMPFAALEAVWQSALANEDYARHIDHARPAPVEEEVAAPEGEDAEYACVYVCGTIFTAGCWKIPGWWSPVCSINGMFVCDAICSPPYSDGLVCLTSYESCNQTCEVCCQKYYGCHKSCWGGCY